MIDSHKIKICNVIDEKEIIHREKNLIKLGIKKKKN